MSDETDDALALAQPLDFDGLEPIQIPVKFRGKSYLLIEASEDVAVKFRNASMRAARMDDGKVIGVDGGADAQPILVAGCLAETDANGAMKTMRDGKPTTVALEIVMRWPSRVVRPLFDRAKKISELDELDTPAALRKQIERLQRQLAKLEESDRPAKNGQQSGASTSDTPGTQDNNSTS